MKPSVKSNEIWRFKPLLWLIVIMVTVFIAYAYYFEIEQHVRASGRIIPAGQSKVVQHLEGGIISKINVREGQKVNKGDVLLLVSNQRAKSDLQEQKISLEALKIKLQRLHAEFNGADTFEVNEKTDDLKMKEIIENEKMVFASRKNALQQKIDIWREQVKQKELRLEDLQSQLTNLQSERNIAQEQFEINERLKKSGAMSSSRYLESKSKVKSFDTRIDQVKKNIPITRAEIQEVRQKIESEKREYNKEITDELSQVELGIQKLTERMKTGYDEVNRTDVLSPTTGIINKLFVNTEGGVIQPGQNLVEIIPLEDNLIVEAKIRTQDRGLIWIGLPAFVKITAYDYAVYGGIDGEISDISADSFTDENSGAQYYRTRIILKQNTIGDGQPLYPGMTVDVNIISGKQRIAHILLKPFWNLRENALREK
tara:strand:+ start:5095 stop:6375 length:1281 start_codon:yes stop_codon:yes gene_type:complete